MEQLELLASDPQPVPFMDEPVPVLPKRERRPSWMIEQDRDNKRIRHERREQKRADREKRRKAREERRERRQGLDEIRNENERQLRELRMVNIADYRFCETCRQFKHYATMGDIICISCEDNLTGESL